MRLGAVFIAACIGLIAASAGATAYLGLGFAATESIIVAAAVAIGLALYNAVSARMSMRTVVSSQLSDLSRENFDIARQMAEMSRRMVAIEGRLDTAQSRARALTDPLATEIGELGMLVKQLAETVAVHEAKFGEIAKAVPAPAPDIGTVVAHAAQAPIDAAPAPIVEAAAPAVSPAPPPEVVEKAPKIDAEAERLALILSAVDANRIDLYLQPIVTLPQRKVRYYEALSRLRSETGDVLLASEFVPLAERNGLMAKIDNLVVFRCVQVVRRLLLKNREIGLFCNLSLSTLTDAAVFQQLLDFLDANRAIAPSFVLEFTQSALRTAGPLEDECLFALADRGFRFSLDNLQDLRIEPRELANRGFRFIKVPGNLLLKPNDAAADIHPADLSDLLGRFGIDLIAEKIENETVVVDLLDYDVRFGQGFLFSPPRPVRAEALQGIADRGDVIVRETGTADEPLPPDTGARNPNEAAGTDGTPAGQRTGGLAQLARGAAGRI